MLTHRRPHAALAALALVALLLAACAPSVLGSRSNPHRLDRDGPLALRAGDTAYVRVDVPRSAFALTREELGPRLAPWGENLARATVTPLFDLRDVIGPDDWEVGLASAVAYLRSTQREADLEVLLTVTAPAGARAGGQRLRADIVDQRGRRHGVEIVVQVAAR